MIKVHSHQLKFIKISHARFLCKIFLLQNRNLSQFKTTNIPIVILLRTNNLKNLKKCRTTSVFVTHFTNIKN